MIWYDWVVRKILKEPLLCKVAKDAISSGNYDASISRCKTLISNIEKITQRRTLTYFASTQDTSAAFINDNDSMQIEDLLRLPNQYNGLDLILNSGGGYAISAERIINVCRTYVNKNKIKEFRVIIPRIAKSAATMVSLGADKIILCNNAELGPIDPQMILIDANGRTISKPAYLIYNAVKGLMDRSHSFFGLNNEKYLLFLRQYNYDIFSSASNELELSKSISQKIFNRKRNKYPKLTEDDFLIFVDPTKTLSHGRLVGFEDLKNTPLCGSGYISDLDTEFSHGGQKGLKKRKIETLNNSIWELLIRKSMLLDDTANAQVKSIEDTNFNFISFNSDWKMPTIQQQPAQNQ
ncbi:MAG: Periplasmic serine protease (ClpP class) [Candidatus Moranbacteria bacterium GW2011_GWE1_36_7]|nr:MAG: Periplasmic serine protease (ClpP class) [Candidatus Moranbacteria bacterium GW2011_GWE1_36_7]